MVVTTKDLLTKIILCMGLIWLSFCIWLSFVAFSKPTPGGTDLEQPIMGLPRLTCVMVFTVRQCVVESPPPNPNSTEIWSEFIGIGPARSGSSNLLWTLQLHQQIQVGEPSLQNLTCCPGSELNFFVKDHLFEQGIEFYKGFFDARRPNARIAGEKTPGYSDHPLVPYRIRGMLGPKVKLLFTLRDPLEALLSLYTLRHQNEQGVIITEFFDNMVQDQKVYDKCVQARLDELPKSVSAGAGSYYDVLSTIDHTTAMLLDEMIMPCWNIKTSMKWVRERLQHYIYKENLIRWHKVLPNQVLCIWSDEFRSSGLKTLNVVLDFLGADPLPSNFTPPSHSTHRDEKLEWKRQLGSRYRTMCDFFIERNRGLEDICPRMWPGEWEWCADAPKKNHSVKGVIDLELKRNSTNS